MATKKRKAKGVKVGPVEEIRLGSIAASYKRKVSPQQWKALVAEAHKRGFSINSFLDPSLPDPLKQRTKESITKQATDTVTTAYAPALKMLTDREEMIKAIDSKRASDNKYYQDWLATKFAELNTSQGKADEMLKAQVAKTHAETAAAYQSLGGNIAATATSVPGTVSDPGQSTAINQGVGNSAQRALGSSEVQSNFINEAVAQRAQDRANAQANLYAQQAAADAKRVSETWKALKEVGDTRQSILLEQGGKIADEISRLLDNEVSKAQSNRDYNLTAATLNFRQEDAAAKNAINAGRAAETARHNSVAEQLAAARVKIAQGQLDVSEGQLDLGWYKARHAGKGKKGTGTASDDPQSRFETAYYGLSIASRGKDSKGKTLRYDAKYIRGHRNEVIAGLINKFHITREMAERVIRAYAMHDYSGSDPGSFKLYGQAKPSNNAAKHPRT